MLLSIVILAPAVVAASPAGGAGPLADYRPGIEGEPSWSLLTLEVDGDARELRLHVDLSNVRCPFAWGFVLLTGSPSEATVYGSVTFDYSYGRQGVEAYASGPITVEESMVDHDGARGCDSGQGFDVNFGLLPEGPLHFLQYKAGTPFEGRATLVTSSGGVRILGETAGDQTFYIGGSDFGNGAGHVATHSPRFCPNPSVNSENGFCESGGWWAGGTLAGSDVGLDRSASHTFGNTPYFVFGNLGSNLDVSNASVTDPYGRTTQARAAVGAWAGRSAVNVGPPLVRTAGRLAQYPAGTYDFSVEMNADVGASLDVPWHAFGVDFAFPQLVEKKVWGRADARPPKAP